MRSGHLTEHGVGPFDALGARERAEWWLENDGDVGTVSTRSMQLASDLLVVLDGWERVEALLSDPLHASRMLSRKEIRVAFEGRGRG